MAPWVAPVIGPARDVTTSSPFHYPVFRALWAFCMLSQMGILVQSVGASWMMVDHGASPQMIASVQTAASVPFILLSPLSGVLADHIDRRIIMIVAQGLLAFVSIGLALLAWQGLASPWALLGFTFLIGCCLAFNGPAWMATAGDIVPRAALANAVVYNAVGLNLSRCVGPAIGGVIVGVGGATANFAVSAVAAIIFVGALSIWRPAPLLAPRAIGSMGKAIMAGIGQVRQNPSIAAALFRAIIFGASVSALQALLPLIARDLLKAGSTTYGLLFASYGLGALGGAMFSGWVRRAMGSENALRLCAVVSSAAAMGIAFSSVPWVTAGFLALAGAFWVVAYSVLNVAVQMASPRWVVARTMSLYQMAVYTGIALGGWLGGLYAGCFGTFVSFLLVAALALASIAAGVLAPLHSVESDGEAVDIGM